MRDTNEIVLSSVMRSVAYISTKLKQRVRHPQLVAPLLERVVGEYEDLTRDYHDVSHLDYGFEWLQRLEKFIVDPALLNLIWLNHDRYWAFGCPLNEFWSAERAVIDAKQFGMGDKDIGVLNAGINATKRHLVPEDYPGHVEDLKILLDIDLSGLGAPLRDFMRTNAAVRAEAGNTPEADVLEGQRKFALSMLERDQIFQTRHFADREAQARKNLQLLVDAA